MTVIIIGWAWSKMGETLQIIGVYIVFVPPFCWRVGVELPTKFSENGWRAGQSGVAVNFYLKNKLKYEIFNDKKTYKQKCFSLS